MAVPRFDPLRLAPAGLAAILAAAYVIAALPSADLAAHVFRAGQFEREGFTLWSNAWFGGHHTPAYSVLFPPLAAWLGPRVAAGLGVVAAAALFEPLVRREFGGVRGERVDAALASSLCFALGAGATLYSGRLAFGFALSFGVASLLALARGHGVLATVLAVLTALASPVAALFVALGGAAVWIGGLGRPPGRATAAAAIGRAGGSLGAAIGGERGAAHDRRGLLRGASGLAVAAGALAPVIVLSFAFPEGGDEPFLLSAFWPTVVFAAAALAFISPERRTLRAGVVLYALGCTAAFAVATPVGGNAARLGALAALPLAACVLWRRHPLVLAVLAVPLLYWQWTAPVHDIAGASGDPSTKASYYSPLLRELERHPGPPGRLEVVFTRNHWEAALVAPRVPLARGWERQLDRRLNPILYGRKPLNARSYHRWLDSLAVRWVALANTELDYSARAEARLIRGGLPYLRERWRNRDWTLYEVRRPAPLATGAGRALGLGPDSFTIRARRAGLIHVRVRYTPYWKVVSGAGCVMPDGDTTAVRAREPGVIRVAARFALGRIGASSPRCSG